MKPVNGLRELRRCCTAQFSPQALRGQDPNLTDLEPGIFARDAAQRQGEWIVNRRSGAGCAAKGLLPVF